MAMPNWWVQPDRGQGYYYNRRNGRRRRRRRQRYKPPRAVTYLRNTWGTPELKWKEWHQYNYPIGSAGGADSVTSWTTYSRLDQGDGVHEYLGNKIKPKTVKMVLGFCLFYDNTEPDPDANPPEYDLTQKNLIHVYLIKHGHYTANPINAGNFQDGSWLSPVPILGDDVANEEYQIVKWRRFTMDGRGTGNQLRRRVTFRYKPKKTIKVSDPGNGYMTDVPVVYIVTNIDTAIVGVRVDVGLYMSWYDQ